MMRLMTEALRPAIKYLGRRLSEVVRKAAQVVVA